MIFVKSFKKYLGFQRACCAFLDVPEVLNGHVNEKKFTFFKRIFFSSSEKLIFEKENVIF